MKAITVVLAILLVIGVAIFLAASSGNGPASVEMSVATSDPPAYLAGTTSRIVESAITGRTYQVSVALPRTYATSNETYPVLYAVDANVEFGMVVETARLMQFEDLIPELIIVGIGYPFETYFEALGRRWLDLTPTEDPGWVERETAANADSPWRIPEGSGGAPGFLQFIREELIPQVEAEYRVDPRRGRALFGHSLGGLFAFYSLFEGEETFDRFIVGSLSMRPDERFPFKLEEAFAETHSSLRARVFFSVGSLESERRISDLRELWEVLADREYDGFEFASHVFEDEAHTSSVPVTISRGLRYIFGDQQ